LTGENDSDEILGDHRLRMPTELFSQAVEGKNSLLLADRRALNSGGNGGDWRPKKGGKQ
jgi:hypothetical protein